MEIAFAVMLGIMFVMVWIIVKLGCTVWFLGKVLEQPTIEKQQKMLDEYYKYEQDITARGEFLG